MNDQATELRKLVLRAMREGQSSHGPPPRMIVLTCGQSGVGVTTLGVNLAVAMAEQGLRIVLVDANMVRAGVARMCGLPERTGNSGLLWARRDIHEVLQLGPAGIQIVPGLRTGGEEPDINSLALERLVRQFTQLGKHADCVIIDVGNGPNELLRRLGQSADDVVVMTTPESTSITDAYARIKLTLSGTTSADLWLVVNQVDSSEQADDIHQRLCQSCERFLGHGIEMLGSIPTDLVVPEAAQRAVPFLLSRPGCVAGRAIQKIGNELVAIDGRRKQARAAA